MGCQAQREGNDSWQSCSSAQLHLPSSNNPQEPATTNSSCVARHSFSGRQSGRSHTGFIFFALANHVRPLLPILPLQSGPPGFAALLVEFVLAAPKPCECICVLLLIVQMTVDNKIL